METRTNSIHTPTEAVRFYLEAWKRVDIFGVFSVLQISTRLQITAASFLGMFLAPPISYRVLGEEEIEGLDSTYIRDVNIEIDFGSGMKVAKLRCVCEKIKGKTETGSKVVPSNTADGGKWGVNPNSLRYGKDNAI